MKRQITTGPLERSRAVRAALFGLAATQRSAAIVQLSTLGYPNRKPMLFAVVADECADEPVRILAVEQLSLCCGPGELDPLVDVLGGAAHPVRNAILRALARGGTPEVLPTLQRHAGDWPAHLQRKAAAAAALIAHRHELPGDEPLPAAEEVQAPEWGGRLRVAPASPIEAAGCILALGADSYGLTLDEEAALTLIGDRCRTLVLVRKDLTLLCDDQQWQARRRLLGLLANWEAIDQTWHLAGLVLATPTDDAQTAGLRVIRPAGQQFLQGALRRQGEALQLELAAVAQPGAFAVEILGRLTPQGLQFERARTSETVLPRQTPALARRR